MICIRARCALSLPIFASLVLVLFVFLFTTAARAQESFKTTDEAVNALVNAARAEDRDGILAILGPDGEDIVSSGDAVADAATLKRFLAAYDAKHEITMEGDSKATLIIGQEDFPFPIPLVQKDKRWLFDTAAGREEILYRRIGRNELDAIQASLAYVDAQNEYAETNPAGAGVGTYAQRIVSQPGKKDGLYWPTPEGETQSPLGALVAEATSAGYRVGGGHAPYRGYYYRILTKQGPDAPGGAIDYVVNGKMIGGFALVAYPAEYGNSGVMTFLVNHDGSVFQKDLGARTSELVRRMTAYNPDASWKKVDTGDLQQ
jgi:Protein of unknown function (DUF2950)